MGDKLTVDRLEEGGTSALEGAGFFAEGDSRPAWPDGVVEVIGLLLGFVLNAGEDLFMEAVKQARGCERLSLLPAFEAGEEQNPGWVGVADVERVVFGGASRIHDLLLPLLDDAEELLHSLRLDPAGGNDDVTHSIPYLLDGSPVDPSRRLKLPSAGQSSLYVGAARSSCPRNPPGLRHSGRA